MKRRAHLDFQRYEALSQKDLVSKQQRDTAEANWKMALAQQQSGQHKLDELKRGYRPEEIAAAEARYHQTQATLEKFERGNRPEDIEAARGALAMDEARYRERQVVAPTAAIVEVLDVRPGRFDRSQTLRSSHYSNAIRSMCVSTFQKRKSVTSDWGQKAEIHVDSFPMRPFNGAVEQINQQAEFLPRNVQTREERVHQVFGVKVRIDDPSHRILAGMAADIKLSPAS